MKFHAAQMAAFRRAQVDDHVPRATAHLEKYFPQKCREIGGDALAWRIRSGVAQARRYGVTSECDVTLYLTLMMVLGPNFADDPALPWAREALTAPELPEAARRMRRLYRMAIEWVERQGGRGDADNGGG